MKKRYRHTKEELEIIDGQIIEVLEEDHPQSLRHVFYRLTDPRLPMPINKTEDGYRLVGRELKKLRELGLVPYSWIIDTTRLGYHVNTFSSPAEFVESHAHLYRADLWSEVSRYVEVWCESRSLAGVIQATCNELAVSLYPAGGFSSWSFIYNAAREIRHVFDSDPNKQDALILYIGDYDPAGVLIDKNIETGLRKHLPNIDLKFERLAVNPDQIIDMALPTKPRKAGERRALHIQETVEAEAIPAAIMRELLRDRIEDELPSYALEITKLVEQSEREGLLKLSESMYKF